MAAMTSFRSVKCRRLVSAHTASARRICSNVRQFLVHSTSLPVNFNITSLLNSDLGHSQYQRASIFLCSSEDVAYENLLCA